jgi:hypothetical protein
MDLKEQSDISALNKDAAAPAVNPSENQTASLVRPLRTFKGDVEETIQLKKLSRADIALQENERRYAQGSPATFTQGNPENRKRLLLIALSVVLLLTLLALGGAFIFFTHQNKKPSAADAIVALVQNQQIIFTESTDHIALMGLSATQLERAIQGKVSEDFHLNTVKQVVFVEKEVPESALNNENLASAFTKIDARTFLTRLDTVAPARFLRSLEDNFMFGVFSFNGTSGFLIFKINAFDAAFADLLAFEQSLPRDILPLLNPKIARSTVLNPQFKDKVIRNIDTRVLPDAEGNILMLYAFIDRETLVIASREDTFTEILSRYHTPKPVIK